MESNTLHINLSDSLHDFVRTEVAQGDFKSPEEYVTALVAAEQRRKAREQLEDMAAEGIASATPEFWDERRRRILEKCGDDGPRTMDDLEALLDEGMSSPLVHVNDQFWTDLRRDLNDRLDRTSDS